MMLWILLTGLALTLTGIFAGTISDRPQLRRIRTWALVVLAGYGLSYCLALIVVSVRPIWVTNGVEVWANFPEHFLWALLMTAWTQIAGVPLAVAGYALYRRLRPRD